MLNNKKLSIGIFDSGIGGLTIAKAIHNILPDAQIVYIGDNAHAPWGDKSKEQIIYYSLTLTQILLDHLCDIIVIACNTASCLASATLTEKFPKVKIFNVIEPIINFLQKLELEAFNNIGIIGTRQTINSDVFQKHLRSMLSINNNENFAMIKTLATPLLVPLIEEGHTEHYITNLILEKYLNKLNLENHSLLILGCTHYHFIKQNLKNHYIKLNKKITLVDAPLLMAQHIKDFFQLNTNQAINNSSDCQEKSNNYTRNSQPIHINNNLFYFTGNNEFFTTTAQQLFTNIKLNYLPLW